MNEKVKVFLGNKLPLFTESVHDFTGMAMKLDSKDITKEDIEAFKRDFFSYKEDEVDDISTKKANMIEAFNEGMAIEMGRVGQTAWGLLQSATHYTNHKHPRAGAEFIATGTGGTLNAKAEKFVLAL